MDHHLPLSNAPSQASLAARRFSRMKEAGRATGSNLAGRYRRSLSSAAAAGESGVGQTLSKAIGPVPQDQELCTTVIARQFFPISRDLRTTITAITWGKRVDLRQIRRVARECRDDWAVRRVSRKLDDQRQCGWTSSSPMMIMIRLPRVPAARLVVLRWPCTRRTRSAHSVRTKVRHSCRPSPPHMVSS